MGEWSDYFEDFPEENPANYVGERYDPKGAEHLRASQSKVKQEQEQDNLDAEIRGIVQKHRTSLLNRQ